MHVSSVTGLVDPSPSGQTPVASPPTKKVREEEPAVETAAAFDSRPTLVLGETIEVDDMLSPIRPDRLEFEETQNEAPAPLPKMSAKAWMCSKPFEDLLEQVLMTPVFDGDFATLDEFQAWPAGIPQTPLTWAYEWRSRDFDLPFPFVIGEDKCKNETLDLMTSSAQSLLLKSQQLIVECLEGKDRLDELLATTDRLHQAKLKALEEKGLSGDELKKAKVGILTWVDGQKNRFQTQFEMMRRDYGQRIGFAVSETGSVLRYLMESHDSVIQRPQLDETKTFVQELEAEIAAEVDAVMQEVPVDPTPSPVPVVPAVPPVEVPSSTTVPPVPPSATEAACSHIIARSIYI